MANIFEVLEKFFYSLLNYSSLLWNWLISEVTILGYSFTPLYSLPLIGITFLTIFITKSFLR